MWFHQVNMNILRIALVLFSYRVGVLKICMLKVIICVGGVGITLLSAKMCYIFNLFRNLCVRD